MLFFYVDNEPNNSTFSINGSVPNSDEDKQKHREQPTENPAEASQEKSDTVTDVKEELCDLSMYKNSVWLYYIAIEVKSY